MSYHANACKRVDLHANACKRVDLHANACQRVDLHANELELMGKTSLTDRYHVILNVQKDASMQLHRCTVSECGLCVLCERAHTHYTYIARHNIHENQTQITSAYHCADTHTSRSTYIRTTRRNTYLSPHTDMHRVFPKFAS
jgi:hypothetical protein